MNYSGHDHQIVLSDRETESRQLITAKRIAARWGNNGAGPPSGRTQCKSYDAAITNRLTSDWISPLARLSSDAELQGGRLRTMRDRSRDAERNDPYAENFLRLAENNVVGHSGFALQMKVIASETADAATGEIMTELDHPVNRLIEKKWKRFCRKENFLVTRDRTAIETLKLIVRTVLRDCDCIIRKVRGYPNEFGFALQLFESDYLDDLYLDFRGVPCQCPQEFTFADGSPYPYCQSGRHEVRFGVELQGDWKFPVAYWLLAHHPGDIFYGQSFAPKRIRVPVEQIIHPFLIKRIEQTRGVPAMVSAMLRLQMLGGYTEAELVAARCAAQKMGFIESEVPDSVADQYFDKDLQSAVINGAPGEIEELPLGKTFKEWNPVHPNANFPGFNKEMLRSYGAGCGVSYTALANDIENVNYSSIRAGLLEEREVWKSLQQFCIDNVLLDIFHDWLKQSLLQGAIELPFSRLDEFTDDDVVIFQGRRWPWVDPQKDVTAAVLSIENNLATRNEVVAERGGDFETVAAELAREEKLMTGLGLSTQIEVARGGGDPHPDPNNPDAQPNQPTHRKTSRNTKTLSKAVQVNRPYL